MSEKVQVVILRELNEKVEVLLLQTNPNRGQFWQNVTGGKEANDTSNFDAAKREVKEETGIELDQNDLFDLDKSFNYYDSNRNTHYLEHIFMARVHTEAITLSTEHQAYRWISANTIQSNNYKFESSFQAFLSALDFFHQEKKT